MEEKIDLIFLNKKAKANDLEKIKHLEECVSKLPSLSSHLELITSKSMNLKLNFELYEVKLESLANELVDIERENTKLENEISYQVAMYEHLKDLLIAVEIPDDCFVSLEAESFDTTEGLAKLEKSVYTLNRFNIEDYSIRIVQEKQDHVRSSLRKFYKRFITHLSKVLIKNEADGELKVHRPLYSLLKKYRFIYKHSTRFSDYYTVLCSIYSNHSKKMYERDFDLHLRTLKKLLSDNISAIETAINVLFESYLMLMKCEEEFLKHMGIQVDLDEIFKDMETLIVGWLKEVYDIANMETLVGIYKILLKNKIIGISSAAQAEQASDKHKMEMDETNEREGNDKQEDNDRGKKNITDKSENPQTSVVGNQAQSIEKIDSLLKRVKECYKLMLASFVKAEKKITNIDKRIKRLSKLRNLCAMNDVLDELSIDLTDKITKPGIVGIQDVINRLSLLFKINTIHSSECVEKAYGDLLKEFDKQTISFVFTADEDRMIAQVNDVITMFGVDKDFKTSIMKEFSRVVLENTNEEMKEDVSKILIRNS